MLAFNRMFGLSFTHLLVLAVIALVVIGPEQLPEVARTIARLLNEWRRATSDLQSSLTKTLHEDLNPLHTDVKHPPAQITVEKTAEGTAEDPHLVHHKKPEDVT